MDAHTFTKQAEKSLNKCSCQKTDGSRILGQERSVDGGIYATPQVYCEMLKKPA
jgi:hypothetical protein